MLINPVSGTTQVNFQEVAANTQYGASWAQNNSALPEDTVTLSPAAQALQTEQKLAAAAAENTLSPAAQALQTEQKLAAAAAQNALSPAGQSLQSEQKLAATTATLWRSALALTSE